MRHMQKWEPLKDLWDLSDDLNDFFFGRGMRGRKGQTEEEITTWTPSIDLYEDTDALKIYADLPGMRREDVSVDVEDGVLSIRGERKFSDEEEKTNFYRIERAYGNFRRSFTLPTNVETGKIAATMKDGILTVTVPKTEESKPKKVDIEVK